MTMDDNNLYVIITNNEEIFIGIISFVEDVIFRGTITRLDILKWYDNDISKAWNPSKILSNDAHNNVIFVLNDKNIYIISVENHTPSYIDLVPLYDY